MKRNFLSLLLMIVLLLSVTAEAEDRFTISDIYEQFNGWRWQADYETVRNETICVDVEISVPQADAIHVLSARYMPKGYEHGPMTLSGERQKRKGCRKSMRSLLHWCSNTDSLT